LALGVLLLFALPVGFIAFMQHLATLRIHDAEVEADQLDPGWRLEDLDAARKQVPDAENSALVVIETSRLLPPKWINWTLPPPQGIELYETLQRQAPNFALTAQQRDQLRAKLQEAQSALEPGRKLSSMPWGRYPIKWSKDALGTLLQEQQNARTVAELLRYDVLLRSQAIDLKDALSSVQALANVGRSLGDEPLSISCLIRMACDRLTVKALEGVLAQGEVDSRQLAEFQRRLEDESRQPLQVIAARGDRAILHRFLEVTEAHGIDRADYQLKTSALGPYFDDFIDGATAVQAHPEHLRYATACVEIAKLPPWEQRGQFPTIAKPQAALPALLVALNRGGEPDKMMVAFHSWLAQLRCAAIALQVEQFRLAEGRWPNKLNELVPKYMPRVPRDPFEGKSLQIRRLQSPSMSGVVVYSVGPDGIYDGGSLERTNQQTTAADIGFRLWDVKDRHQQPSK
jgi:hypothetical protein